MDDESSKGKELTVIITAALCKERNDGLWIDAGAHVIDALGTVGTAPVLVIVAEAPAVVSAAAAGGRGRE